MQTVRVPAGNIVIQIADRVVAMRAGRAVWTPFGRCT